MYIKIDVSSPEKPGYNLHKLNDFRANTRSVKVKEFLLEKKFVKIVLPGKESAVSSFRIAVVTQDFDAGKEVEAVRRKLRLFGAGGKMIYKAQVFSRCNIFARNEFNVQHTLFEDKNPNKTRGVPY